MKGVKKKTPTHTHMDINNVRFYFWGGFAHFYEEGKAFNMFVRSQGYKQYIVMRSAECKHKLFVQENSTGLL